MSSITTLQNHPHSNTDAFIFQYIQDRIDYRIRQLAIQFDLSEDEQNDYRGDMTAEVHAAMRRFDPAKSKRETFVNRVLDRFVLHVTRSRCNRLKQACFNPVGFADIGDTFEPVTNECRQGERNQTTRADLRMDVEQVVAGMPPRLQEAARLLMEMSPGDAARAMGIHRRSIYRFTAAIREHFMRAGLHDLQTSRDEIATAADVEGARKECNNNA